MKPWCLHHHETLPCSTCDSQNDSRELREKIDELCVLSLRKAYAYAYDKGQNFDQVPDHEKAGAIKDELADQLIQLITQRDLEQRELARQELLEGSRQALLHYNWSWDKDYQLAVIAFREIIEAHSTAPKEENEPEYHDADCDQYKGVAFCFCPGREAMLRNLKRGEQE